MIIKLICAPFVLMIKGLIALIPASTFTGNSIASLLHLIMVGVNFFPPDVLIMVLGSVVFWFTARIIIVVYTFVLDLIPFLR